VRSLAERRRCSPRKVTRLVAERLNAGDAAGMAALYEPQAVLAYPADQPVTGREAIQAICRQMADAGATFAVETRCPPSGSRTWR
jgi:ketosteroid isomerase-like protein